MDEFTDWSAGMVAEVHGHGVINHAGAVALRVIADRTGLTEGCSGALTRRGDVIEDAA